MRIFWKYININNFKFLGSFFSFGSSKAKNLTIVVPIVWSFLKLDRIILEK